MNAAVHARNFIQKLRVSGCTGPAVRIFGGSRWITNDPTTVGMLEASPTGPANTDVGLQVDADINNVVQMKTGNTLTGTVGDVRFNGVVDTWANYEASSPNLDAPSQTIFTILP